MRLRNLHPNIALILLLLTVTAAVAQTAAPTQGTVISVNELLAPWLPIIVSTVVTLILALLTAITVWIKQRFNLQNSETFANLEARARETLQSALENAAGRTVLVLGDRLKDAKLNVGMPEIRSAVLNVNKSAADAVAKFDLSEERIAQMIIDKVGVITASNPQVVPTVEPAVLPNPISSVPRSTG